MKLRGPYEIDSEGFLHDEESEDVMDLDSTEVLNFLDINHEMLPKDEGVGFCESLERRLDDLEDIWTDVEDVEAEDLPENF